MKIFGIVILYHPSKKEILNINTYLSFLDKLLIYDNTDNTTNLDLLKYLKSDNYIYFPQKKNMGLCIPLNYALEEAYKNNCDFLLTMDQDSYFLEYDISTYINEIKKFNNIEKIGQFGVNYHEFIKRDLTNNFYDYCNYNITSGSVINIKAIKNNNIRFDENLFIDSVDFDFSFQIILKSLKNITFNRIYLQHNLGETKLRASFKSLYLLSKRKNIHSEIRLYYIIRNLLYLKQKYKNSNINIINEINKINNIMNKHIKNSIYYANNPIKSILYVLQAKKDFKNNIFGKKR